MEKQIGIYCSHQEWIGVVAAVREGMVVIEKKARAGGEREFDAFRQADAGSATFQERLIEELGLQPAYDAYRKGDYDKAKVLAEAKGKADLHAIERGEF